MNQKNIFKNFILVLPGIFVLIFVLYLMQRASSLADTGTIHTATEVQDYSIHFSVPSGFYDEDFTLELSGPEGFAIYYTLDGSTPHAGSNLYTTPLLVTNVSGQDKKYANRTDFSPSGNVVEGGNQDKAYIIRAIAINAEGISTDIANATFFVGYGNAYAEYAVVSLITDPNNLFDSATGIYVLGDSYQEHVQNGGDPSDDHLANYVQKGIEWERPVYIDYFDNDKNYIFSQDGGIRINDNSSRSDSRKSLRLYARKEYDGNSLFTYPLFDEKMYLNSFILRRGIFENQFLPSLVYDRDISTQEYISCIVFLDGEYWGRYYLIERYDADYMEAHYNVDSDNVTIIKDAALYEGSQIIYNEYTELLTYMSSHDLSIPENYEYVCSKLDIQSYIDYYSTQIYINNYDFSEIKNQVLWRANEIDATNPYADGKWRFSLMDVDLSLTSYANPDAYTKNSFTDPTAVSVHTEEIMLKALLANEDFRRQFVTTFLDLENENFLYETVLAKLDEQANSSTDTTIIREFFEKRPTYINEHLATTFSLEGVLSEVTLETNDVTAGSIQLNSITPELAGGTWQGNYYTDYPISVTALPTEGYHFKHWIIDGTTYTDAEISIPVSETGTHIQAIFEAD